MEFEAASNEVQALPPRSSSNEGRKELAEYLLKPYTHPEPGKEFFEFQIPSDADQCLVELKIMKKTKTVRFTDFRMVVESPK